MNRSTVPSVMIVDDDGMARILASESLEQAGFNTALAEDGLEAVSLIESVRPDIVLMDVEMPNMNGYTACAKIREIPGFSTLPILMLTGLDDASSINLAYDAGATDFATKPINWPLLAHRIRYLLRSHETLDALERSRVSLDTAQRLAGIGSWEWNARDNDVMWSGQIFRILGLSMGDVKPCLSLFLDHVSEGDRYRVEEWMCATDDAMVGSGITHEVLTVHGELRVVRQQLEIERHTDGTLARKRGVVHDITEQQKAERKIHQLAYYDSLTRLPNRELFSERLAQALSSAKRHNRQLAVMFLDMDDFKRVNDTLGHAFGDQLLQEVGDRLEGCIRETDAIAAQAARDPSATVARMGGDEFTVLLNEVSDLADAVQVAERITRVLSKAYSLGENDVYTTPSVGVACYPQHGDTTDELMKCADMAMYFAKREGKSCVRVYESVMNDESILRYSMEMKLRKALIEDELSLHYQPQMNLETGTLEGVEALIRWANTELGDVSPAEFIPLAEETGLIVPIGEWVLRTACMQAKDWIDAGMPLVRMAVNISVLQFVRPDFPQLVEQILEESGLPAPVLELEITESVLAMDTTGAVSTLQALKAIGVQLSIDDFGTGYSSLSQLKNFPIDRLKIDQSFVAGITSNTQDAAITRAVLAMAESMDLKVVAEGVETSEQLTFLQGSQCDEVQGFFLSRPLPTDQIMEVFLADAQQLKKTGSD